MKNFWKVTKHVFSQLQSCFRLLHGYLISFPWLLSCKWGGTSEHFSLSPRSFLDIFPESFPSPRNCGSTGVLDSCSCTVVLWRATNHGNNWGHFHPPRTSVAPSVLILSLLRRHKAQDIIHLTFPFWWSK